MLKLDEADVDVGAELDSTDSVLDDDDDDDDDAEEEDELDDDVEVELCVTSVSETGILTEVEVGAPGRGPFDISILLVILAAEPEAVEAAALTALERSTSAFSLSSSLLEEAAEPDCRTGLTTTAGAESSSIN